MNEWQPLTEIWETYNDSLSNALDEGFIDDPSMADDYVWPMDLRIGDWEQDDVKRYVHERMTEIIDKVKSDRGLDPNLVAGYLFRSILCGMMWERERIGR